MITKEDIGEYTFQNYRKKTITRISDEVLPTGTEVMTKEGKYVCAGPSRLAIDTAGDVYPIEVKVFEDSYEMV